MVWGISVFAFSGALMAAGLSACGSTPIAKDTSGNPLVEDDKQADAQLGAKVRVVGEAVNAKLSAAIEGDDGWVVYLVDMRQWPDEIEGKTVEVTGILGKRQEVVAPPGPEPSAGTDKPVHVLRESSYLVMDD